MPFYCLSSGNGTTSKDPARILWYGLCTYWTDDWTLVDIQADGIPKCPHCGSVGFVTTAEVWLEGAKQYSQRPFCADYLDYLLEVKEKCFAKVSVTDAYHLHHMGQLKLN